VRLVDRVNDQDVGLKGVGSGVDLSTREDLLVCAADAPHELIDADAACIPVMVGVGHHIPRDGSSHLVEALSVKPEACHL